LSNDGVKQIILVYLDGENIERDENPLKKLDDKGENVSFFFVSMIIQKLIDYTILALRKLLLFVILFSIKLSFRHGAMIVLNKLFHWI
jgi:hypothetical protein